MSINSGGGDDPSAMPSGVVNVFCKASMLWSKFLDLTFNFSSPKGQGQSWYWGFDSFFCSNKNAPILRIFSSLSHRKVCVECKTMGYCSCQSFCMNRMESVLYTIIAKRFRRALPRLWGRLVCVCPVATHYFQGHISRRGVCMHIK